ncbi:hypothetical protein TB1_002081 [Malus domestica]
MPLTEVTRLVVNTNEVYCFRKSCLRVLSACNSQSLPGGICVRSAITKPRLDDDLYSANNLLSLYACSGVVSWTGVLSAYVRNGHHHVSLEFFDSTIVSGAVPK